MTELVELADISKAQERIAGVAARTPLLPVRDPYANEAVWLKPENLQPMGAFKIRGAYNRLAQLVEDGYDGGILAYSSGNHAQGVAYATQKLGLLATIVMPANAPEVKMNATKAYGATVVTYDPATENREVVADKLQKESGSIIVPPYNDLGIIAGQGTIGLEIVEDLPEVDLIVVPVGGGGLISGIATAVKSLLPSAKVVGVEPELAADAKASLESGKIVELAPEAAARTIADGVRTLHLGDHTFAHMQHYVDAIVTVSETEIIQSASELLFKNKLLVEPSGALAFAAYRFHRAELPSASQTALILSGGNADASFVRQLSSS